MVRRMLVCMFVFCSGIAAGLLLSWYVSPVWSYNESIGIREALVDASVSQYREGRLAEAAVLMQEANNVAGRSDKTWPLFFPWHGTILRITGAFSAIHVNPDYRSPETAYLFRTAGEMERARPYYEHLETQRDRSPDQIDASAAAFLREAAAFQEHEGAR